tara:strand:- start:534 stop:1445 length:912 start_codon:yes stop_codon:yes gene_type:complete
MEIITNNKLLIVGGSGFIGKYTVNKSLELGYQTTVLSKNNTNSVDRLNDVAYLSADIGHKESLLYALKDRTFDYVINLGGYVDHSHFSTGGGEVFNVHFNGLRNLVECLDRQKIKGFVQIGSSDEYGNNIAPQVELQREDPISPYSCAKVMSTFFLQTLYKTEKFPAVILRPFLLYGPGQRDNRLIPQIIKGCKSDVQFPVSHGEQTRDFCYIDDFTCAVFESLDNSDAFGEVINIASGVPVSIKDLIKKIVKIIGFGRPKFGIIPYKPLENMNLYADISKAERILQWHPSTSLDKGLRKTIF